MDNYEQQKEATTNKVRFSISQDGKIEFDAQGLSEWEVSDAINQVANQAREQQKATQKIKEVALTGDIVMHCLALGFITLIVGTTGFTVSRVVSGVFHQSGVVHHVK